MSLLPATGPVAAFYGDDFTGSAAVAEVLSFAGIPTILFLGVPSPQTRARFSGYRAFGIAGDARSRGPGWMRAELPRIFALLRGYGAPILHYKICSTLDSAPDLGSIGVAAELGIGDWAPLVVASPRIGRYQAFGTLFARGGDTVHRLDRHPTMSVHPATPMDEADVRRHLARQTDLPIGLVDILDLREGRAEEALTRERASGRRIVAFDLMDGPDAAAIGATIWRAAARAPLFAIGSQGVEDALIAAFEAGGHRAPTPPRAGPAGRIAVVSGSCSPDTARQIAVAEARGFAPVRLDPMQALSPRGWAAACDLAGAVALQAISQGRDPLVFTACGPDDPSIAALAAAIARAGADARKVHAAIGSGLGHILARLVGGAGLRRVVIAGGDTSSHATGALGLVALTAAATIGPAVPLLEGHPSDPAEPLLEIVLKGGQMGSPDLFPMVRDGV